MASFEPSSRKNTKIIVPQEQSFHSLSQRYRVSLCARMMAVGQNENHIATNNLSKTENSMIKNDPSATSLGQIIKSQQGCTDNQVLQFEKQRKMFEDTLVLVIEVFNTRENNSTCLSEVLTNIRKVMKKNLSYFDIADLQFIRLPQNIHSLIEQDGSNKTTFRKLS